MEKVTNKGAGARSDPGEEAPFVWLSQAGVSVVSGLYEEPRKKLTARSIYLALAEIANDLGTPRLEDLSHADIAHRAGMESARTVGDYLKDFKAAGVLGIETPNGERAKWIYTLLSIRTEFLRTKLLRTDVRNIGSQRYIKKNRKNGSTKKKKRGSIV